MSNSNYCLFKVCLKDLIRFQTRLEWTRWQRVLHILLTECNFRLQALQRGWRHVPRLTLRLKLHPQIRLQSKIIIHLRCPPSMIVLHLRLSSIKGRPPSKRLPSKVIFHQRSYSTKGCLPSRVFFHQRSYSIKGRLPSKVVLRQRLVSQQRSSSVKRSLLS